MRKETILNEIISDLLIVEEYLDIKESIIPTVKKLTVKELKEYQKKLKDVHAAVKEVLFRKNHIPESVWKHYKLHDVQNMPEQLLLAKAVKQLRKAWMTYDKNPN